MIHQRMVGRLMLYSLYATLSLHFLLVIIMLIVAWKYQDYLEWDDGSEWMEMPEKPDRSGTGFSLGHFSQRSSGHFSRSSSGHFSQQSSNERTTHRPQFEATPGPYKRPEEEMDDYNDWIVEPEDWIMDPSNSFKFKILNIHLLLLTPPLIGGISFIENSYHVYSLLFQVITFILFTITIPMDLYHVSTGLIITRVFFYINWTGIILLSIISLHLIFPRKENKVTVQEIRRDQGSLVGQEIPDSSLTQHSM